MAMGGAAKAVVFPYKAAKKARNVTGYVAESVGRGMVYAASLPGRGKRALGRLVSAQNRRLAN
jgi:hypothetical protein